MQARMEHPVMIIPGAFDALLALGKAGASGGLPQTTINLVLLRASQINGCSVCAHMHARDARKAG
ncbi:MAG: carboxymuconolactone decarboxylase family protein, partial [Candidatus Dormibacteraeota bacterium]|nr:carboxymuconolactone decarboxylase family protein [Candidatus Dormibacteraeota bacterium]